MTTITIFQSADGTYKGDRCEGHAGFAERGSDIVCAAVSVLVINAVNSIETFSRQAFSCEQDAENGSIDLELKEQPEKETVLLLDSMVLGLKQVEQQYGKKYLRVKFKEV